MKSRSKQAIAVLVSAATSLAIGLSYAQTGAPGSSGTTPAGSANGTSGPETTPPGTSTTPATPGSMGATSSPDSTSTPSSATGTAPDSSTNSEQLAPRADRN
jgi:hypothetical protein